jgi:tRNA(Ser,Leu) C12 N-acetylase TAN1
MARRGRPKKVNTETTELVKIDYAKLLKQTEEQHKLQLETFYKDLANLKGKIQTALDKIGFIDEAESLSQAAFKAGRAFGPLDEANDKIEEMLEDLYRNTDLDHWDDIDYN